jgi:DHA2 family lincomycin resistance protein-like MFS transporter
MPVICGSALIIGPVQSLALSHLGPEQNPHGVTVMSTGFQIAGCVGSSVFVGVYGSVTSFGMDSEGAQLAAASKGFLAVGLLTAVISLIGIGLAVAINRFKAPVHAHFCG